ncbi:TPR repeat-containing protein [Catenulispora acidiphila DSM 44928]|uniref:TPR repeat-containing protein n=1 Tax=Catenulispora acidiphila (strain DSM 44928 / JCM 14897 / NBRC 102108 / NRRL B-24433 / ID139908) TaxID=479433 RepID=C7QGT4_CATAD|nr:hypothetical protein [Catenulispora acidiphila]ACU74964.1 TPR repeat-containing protein [Catenulispora acidiphila DSM 44928]
MTSPSPAPEATDALTTAEELLAAEDIAGLVRHLRTQGETLPLLDYVRVLRDAARGMGFDAMVVAGDRVLEAGDDRAEQAVGLYEFGYECVEHGIAFLAIRALREAAEREPGVIQIRTELAAACERSWEHREAMAALRGFEGELPWLARYQLAFNALLAGDVPTAEEEFAALPELEAQEREDLAPLREKVRAMLVRAAEVAVSDGALGPKDLRGWHYALTGGVLLTVSPYGYDAGMTGRWAMVGDSYGAAAEVLRRLGVLLAAKGLTPETVSLLPDRDSRIMGLAAAQYFGLPAVPFAAEREDTLVVAYDLNEAEPEVLAALRNRVPGQILFERATDWTDPPLAAADAVGFLRQAVREPWGAGFRIVDGEVVDTEPDARPVEEIAAELAATEPEADEGDGQTPADPDAVLEAFLAAVEGTWLTARREYVGSPGPVPSSRFL